MAGRPGASPPHPVPTDGVPSRPRRPRGIPGAGRQSEAEALNEFHGLQINLAAMSVRVGCRNLATEEPELMQPKFSLDGKVSLVTGPARGTCSGRPAHKGA